MGKLLNELIHKNMASIMDAIFDNGYINIMFLIYNYKLTK